MLYHPLMLNEPLYRIGYRKTDKYPEHKHPEIELFYCYKGSYNIIINRVHYTMHKGDLAIIGSMLSHEIPDTNHEFDSECMVIEAGPAMLGNCFRLLSASEFESPVLELTNDKHSLLYNLLEETNNRRMLRDNTASLVIKGNIYNIFAYIIENLTYKSSTVSRENATIINIDNALEHIHNNYEDKITIEEVASLCGYSKTNFCKIFKSVTGETFHSVLNSYRIKIAKTLLVNSDLSIEEIAVRTGFGDIKTFYRTFKQTTGMSPGSYKKATDV